LEKVNEEVARLFCDWMIEKLKDWKISPQSDNCV
jgi:hypothetical protein